MPSVLDDLPEEYARHRRLDSKQASAFVNLNEEYWRRLHREGKTPRALKLSERKLGWRICDLIDWQNKRAASEAEAA